MRQKDLEAPSKLDERQRRMHALLGPISGTGLEIGPLTRPLFIPDDADIKYLDLHTGDDLRAHYAGDPNVSPDEIVDPDFVLIGPDGPLTLLEAVGGAAPFSWLVASHVVEHVPDLIGWLHQVADILVDDGVVLLAVPDRRFTFDAGRQPTTVGQMVQAHDDGDRTPSARAVYDHFSRAVTIDVLAAWRGEPVTRAADRHSPEMGMIHVGMQREGRYVDCHVWLWSPESFVEQLAELAELGDSPFVVEAMDPTSEAQDEFYVRLRRLPRGADELARRGALAASLTSWFDGPVPVPGPDGHGPKRLSELSSKEQSLITMKRTAILSVRRATRKLRPGR